MQIFFFDTETTGLESQDRIIQFWAIFWFYDKEADVFFDERIINQMINTDREISKWASDIHHITKEKISKFKYMDSYIKEFLAYMNKADLVVCHNVDFDMRMLKRECEILWITFDRSKVKTLCTMKHPATQEVMWSSKWAKLQDLHEKIFWEKFEDAHDALCDITATKKCFCEMYRKNKIVLF